jgi:hypothetical protein
LLKKGKKYLNPADVKQKNKPKINSLRSSCPETTLRPMICDRLIREKSHIPILPTLGPVILFISNSYGMNIQAFYIHYEK